jgi:hypothetical protein
VRDGSTGHRSGDRKQTTLWQRRIVAQPQQIRSSAAHEQVGARNPSVPVMSRLQQVGVTYGPRSLAVGEGVQRLRCCPSSPAQHSHSGAARIG